MYRIGLLFPLLFCFLSTDACINVHQTLLDGRVIETDPTSGIVYPKKMDRYQVQERAKELWKMYIQDSSLEVLSDYAASLIFLGKYQKAKELYLTIEQQRPGYYMTASNLGTIYELQGQADSALYWIKEGMVRNPDSHGGSEWIHVKILEHKLNPSANSKASILGLDFGTEAIPANPDQINMNGTRRHLRSQLAERLVFIQPPNVIMGNLYFDYGNLLAQEVTVEAALESYAMARQFGFESELLDRREAALKKLGRHAAVARNWQAFLHFGLDHFFSFFLAGCATLVLLIILWRRRRR